MMQSRGTALPAGGGREKHFGIADIPKVVMLLGYKENNSVSSGIPAPCMPVSAVAEEDLCSAPVLRDPPRYVLTSLSLCERIFTFSVCFSHPPESVCVLLWLQQGLVLALYTCLTGAGGGQGLAERAGWAALGGRALFSVPFLLSLTDLITLAIDPAG